MAAILTSVKEVVLTFLFQAGLEAWRLLLESSIYILFGILVSGLMRVFLNPNTVVRHFGQGRFSSVFKAALLGIPIPLCSCGVLPAAVSLKKQGADKGAVTAFLISTPESGVDSIAVTYAMMDPIMTLARPVAAFATAAAAGVLENTLDPPDQNREASVRPDLTCTVDGCCSGEDCPPEVHSRHHSFVEKCGAGIRYALTEVWGDMAGWFFTGLVLAGVITALMPQDFISRFLSGGLSSMLIMLAVGIPLYICATASTPIAAALILKGVSPGAALVFLLVGPATNITSLTVLFGILGKKATALYLAVLSAMAVGFGLLLDRIYLWSGISPQAVIGQAGEAIPGWLQWAGLSVLLVLSVKPLAEALRRRWLWVKRGIAGAEASDHRKDPDRTSCATGGT